MATLRAEYLGFLLFITAYLLGCFVAHTIHTKHGFANVFAVMARVDDDATDRQQSDDLRARHVCLHVEPNFVFLLIVTRAADAAAAARAVPHGRIDADT